MLARISSAMQLTIVVINAAIDSIRKVALKDAIATVATSQFYKAKMSDKRAMRLRKIAHALYCEASSNFQTFYDDDVDDAFKRALLLNCKEVFCIAQRMQNTVERDDKDAERIAKLREQSEATAKRIAKLEAKQAKRQAKQVKQQAKRQAKQATAKLRKRDFAKMSKAELLNVSDAQREAMSEAELREYRICLTIASSDKSREQATAYVLELEATQQARHDMLAQMSDSERQAYDELEVDERSAMLRDFIKQSATA